MLLSSMALVGSFIVSALIIVKSDSKSSDKTEQQPIIINNNIHELDVSKEINKLHEELMQITHDKTLDNELYTLNKEIADCLNKLN